MTITLRHRNFRVSKVSMRSSHTASRRAVSGKGGKLMTEEGGAASSGRALRSRAASALRHKVLSKIVTAATRQLGHIDDAFMPHLLRRVRFDDALEEVLRTALIPDPSPAAKSPTIATTIAAEN